MTENQAERKSKPISHDGDPKKVFADLERFANLVKIGKIPDTGPLLLVGSGSQVGVNSGGGVSFLEEMRWGNAVKYLVGISTGAPVVSYFASGQAVLGTKIYSGPNTGKEFINKRRGLSGGSLVDIDWLCDKNFREGGSKLDIEAMRRCVADIYYGVTVFETGKGVLVNAKDLPDPIEGIRGSCAIPELYMGEVYLPVGESGENIRVVDGGVGLPLPIGECVEKFAPTSVLIFPNRPKGHKDSLMEFLLKKYEQLAVDSHLQKAVGECDQKFWEEIKKLKDLNIPYLIVWPDDTVKALERDKSKLNSAAENYKKYLYDLHAKCK
jgi:predicted patatin/cPLA2 family phospholipase